MTTKNRIKRFTLLQRLSHIFLIITFLVQSATGLGRMYMETDFGQGLCWIFGGYETTLEVHIWFGLIMLGGFVLHACYLVSKINWTNFPKSLFGPDSMLPRGADIKDFFQHVAWFFGLRPAPAFDRWGYWEKFDYWAVFWGMVIIGVTGLLLAWPIATSRIIPGWSLNVMFWIHRIEAILAMGHVFIIHYFIAHLRRHNFPMDRGMFEGSVSIEDAIHERPAWIERLESKGLLSGLLVSDAAFSQRIVQYLIGFVAMGIGVFLLIGAIVNAPYIHL